MMAQFVLGKKSEYVPRGEDGDFPLIPENEVLNCTVDSVESQPRTYSNPEIKERAEREGWDPDQIHFKVRVDDGEFAKRVLHGNTGSSFTWSPNCTFRLWVEAILGLDELPDDFELNLPALKGLKCRVVTKNYTRKKDGKKKEIIGDIWKARATTSAGATFGTG